MGNAVAVKEVSAMWHDIFSNQFNSFDVETVKQQFYARKHLEEQTINRCVSVNDLSVALSRQNEKLSVGPNGVFMESLLYADCRLYVHLCLLLNKHLLTYLHNFCLRHCYLSSLYEFIVVIYCEK